MSRDFTIRSFHETDEEEVVNLLRSVFPGWKKRESALEYWRWKYIDTPLKSDILVSVSAGKVIGVMPGINFNIKIRDQVFPCNYGDDAAVDEAFQGLGVNTNLTILRVKRASENGIKLNYLITINPIVIDFQRRRGRNELPHPTSHLVRVKNVSLHLKEKNVDRNPVATKLGITLLKNMNKVRNLFVSRSNTRDPFSIAEASFFDERIDLFWDKVKDSYDFIHEMKKEFLNWRYCDPRGGNYLVRQAVKDEEILGYIVLELKKDNEYREGYIADILTLPDRDDVAEALIRDACGFFDKLQINMIHCRIVKDNQYQRILSKNGFIDDPLATKVFVFITLFEDKGEYEIIKASSPSRIHFSGDFF